MARLTAKWATRQAEILIVQGDPIKRQQFKQRQRLIDKKPAKA